MDGGFRDSGTAQPVGVNEMVRNSSRDVMYSRKWKETRPLPYLGCAWNASEMVDIHGLLNVGDLLRADEVDQEDFEMRAREAEWVEAGTQEVSSLFPIWLWQQMNDLQYASTTIILGKREYVLLIVVSHCIEEVYQTGVSPPFYFWLIYINLFHKALA